MVTTFFINIIVPQSALCPWPDKCVSDNIQTLLNLQQTETASAN